MGAPKSINLHKNLTNLQKLEKNHGQLVLLNNRIPKKFTMFELSAHQRYHLQASGDVDASIYIVSLPSEDNFLPGKISFEDPAGRFEGTYEISEDGSHLEISDPSGDNSYLLKPIQHAGESYLTIAGLCYTLADFDIQEAGRQRSLSHVSVLMFDTHFDEMNYMNPADEVLYNPLDSLMEVEC